MTLLGLGIACILFALSILHVFWACGGQWGGKAAVPEVHGRPAFVPSVGMTLAVAGALMLATAVVLGRANVFFGALPRWLFTWGAWGLSAVFLARALGDGRQCGFFKQVRGTTFARLDSYVFSPLCLGLGLGVGWIAWH